MCDVTVYACIAAMYNTRIILISFVLISFGFWLNIFSDADDDYSLVNASGSYNFSRWTPHNEHPIHILGTPVSVSGSISQSSSPSRMANGLTTWKLDWNARILDQFSLMKAASIYQGVENGTKQKLIIDFYTHYRPIFQQTDRG